MQCIANCTAKVYHKVQFLPQYSAGKCIRNYNNCIALAAGVQRWATLHYTIASTALALARVHGRATLHCIALGAGRGAGMGWIYHSNGHRLQRRCTRSKNGSCRSCCWKKHCAKWVIWSALCIKLIPNRYYHLGWSNWKKCPREIYLLI